MRELKFRAWDGKEMKPAFDLTQNPKFWWEENKDYPLMQYTALKDKNGKDIYEGDVIKREFEIYSQVYDESTFALVDVDIEDSGYFVGVVNYRPSEGFILNKCSKYDDSGKLLEKRTGVKIYASRAKVIGNIYENPKLLEGDTD